ncbi:MAG: hypothetical protein IJY91_07060 [Oscillospiraceae bacterium]|nr:hypothetical protein [Oscillospiraceae bacterium]
MDTSYAKISDIISQAKPEGVFVASDFSHIAPINTVRQYLSRLEKSQQIVRIMRGVYYQPAYSELLQEYEAPSPHHVAMALSRNFGWTIAPSGATALNMLGLSTQVPARWSFVSDGPYRSFSFGNITMEFKHCSSKETSGMSDKTALVIQAIKALGKENIDEVHIQRIRRSLSAKEKTVLLEEARHTTAWIFETIKKVCKETE